MKVLKILSLTIFALSLVGIIAISANESEISKYKNNGNKANGTVQSLNKEVVKTGKRSSETRFSVWIKMPFKQDTILALMGNNMTNGQFNELKVGGRIEVVYLEDYIYLDEETFTNNGESEYPIASIDRDIYLLEHIETSSQRFGQYYWFVGIGLITSFLLFAIYRIKRKRLRSI